MDKIERAALNVLREMEDKGLLQTLLDMDDASAEDGEEPIAAATVAKARALLA